MGDGPLSEMDVATVIQARMRSSRLPGKVMLPLPVDGSVPLLRRITGALTRSDAADRIVVATSRSGRDDPIAEEFRDDEAILLYRGSEEDVLSRFAAIAEAHSPRAVVRITGDNPFTDPRIVNRAVEHHLQKDNHYTGTRGLPLGMNVEVVSGEALIALNEMELSSRHREHVTLYFKEGKEFRRGMIDLDEEELAGLRLTVDYPSDFALASLLYSLMDEGEAPTLEFIRDVYRTRPWLFDINRDQLQKRSFENPGQEMRYAAEVLRELDLERAARKLEDGEG